MFIRNKSARTIATIASPIGTALIPTHGSCLPLVLMSVFVPSTSIVYFLVNIELVGLTANLITIS